MSIEIYFAAVCLLLFFAVIDLVVGVSNDAVNFLNSSIGSRVAPRYFIMIIASLGILAGVLFSSGMMEVARKGIFHPQFFTMPELITVFLAVMLTDIIILDIFNTFGLPTSTTVSIVFELLGAAVAVSIIKILQSEHDLVSLSEYINTAKAMTIIFGILLSVVVAFCCGAVVQFISRLIFSFEYQRNLKRFGALWGSVALASTALLIVVKGAKGAAFMTPENVAWLRLHWIEIAVSVFCVSAVILQALITFFRFNILKLIVLIGTFALAMAFAANDLVNFIGVPLAGLHAFKAALLSSDPLSVNMVALSGKVQSETAFLLIAGVIMVVTLWLSKKSRSVSETELSLGRQDEGLERFESVLAARVIVRIVGGFFDWLRKVVPLPIRDFIKKRIDPAVYEQIADDNQRPEFDLIRASVNLMVASAVVSLATSMKLPLSTTYVTFMVAMGSSFADRAWGSDSAVYRVTGVLTVIAGWFFTALMAFSIAFVCANVIHFCGVTGIVAVVVIAAYIFWKTHHTHEGRVKDSEQNQIFNLKKVNNASDAISTTFEHMAIFLQEIRQSLDLTLQSLLRRDLSDLRKHKRQVKKIQVWSNIITANIFKALRFLENDDVANWYKYAQTIRCLQSVTEGHRDIVLRSFIHVAENHKDLLDVQEIEIQEIWAALSSILVEVEAVLRKKHVLDYQAMREKHDHLRGLVDKYNQNQVERIRNRDSKTRLSILFYSVIGNFRRLSRQNLRLLEIFQESFPVGEARILPGVDD